MAVLRDDEKLSPLVFLSYVRDSRRDRDRSLTELEYELASLYEFRNQLTHATEPAVLVVDRWDPAARPQVDHGSRFIHQFVLPNPIDLCGAAATFVAGTAASVPATGFRAGASLPIPTPDAALAGALATYGLQHQLPLDDQPGVTFWPLDGASPPVVAAPEAVPQGSPPGMEFVAQEILAALGITPLPVGAPTAEPRRLAFAVNLATLPDLREYFVQLIDMRKAALRREIGRRLAVLISFLDMPRFGLRLLAVSRRYGRRDEPDDHALLAHRWLSVIGGEPALSC
jgi:hypothetical protein